MAQFAAIEALSVGMMMPKSNKAEYLKRRDYILENIELVSELLKT